MPGCTERNFRSLADGLLEHGRELRCAEPVTIVGGDARMRTREPMLSMR